MKAMLSSSSRRKRRRGIRKKISFKKIVMYISMCTLVYICVVWMFLVYNRASNRTKNDKNVFDDGFEYFRPSSLRSGQKKKDKAVTRLERMNWCLEVNDEYSMKKPPLMMGLQWGLLSKESQERWKEFECNRIIDWTSSKEDAQAWCNAAYGHSMNEDMRRKYDGVRCDDILHRQRDRKSDSITTSGGRSFYTAQDCMNAGKSCGTLFSSHWHGRFGNRLFQYVYACTYARMHSPTVVYGASKWEGSILFDPKQMCIQTYENPLGDALLKTRDMVGEDKDVHRAIEMHQNVHPSWSMPRYWEPQNNPNPLAAHETLPNVWFNTLHMMYNRFMMSHIRAEHVKELLQFSDQVKQTSIYKKLYESRGTYDVAHVRRGDILTTKITKKNGACTLCIVSLESYKRQMRKVGVNPDDVIWISNDPQIETVQYWHEDLRAQSKGKSSKYPVGSSEIPKYIYQFLPDFLLMYFARRIFRAPSSFSFWAAFMNDQPNKVVYSPNMHKCEKSDTQIEGRPQEYDCLFEKHNRNAWMTHPIPGKPGETWSDIIFA